jgi:hypothetical protein
MATSDGDEHVVGPWYRSDTGAALAVSGALFVVVTVTQLLIPTTGEAVDILYALPVALLAMTFGLRGGLVGSAVGLSLFAVVELGFGSGDIDASGWLSRAAGLFLLGALLGRATDQVDAGRRRSLEAADERRRLEERARRQAEGLEISDSILQHIAVAKWMIEAGDIDGAVDVLTSTMATGERMVADLLPIRHTDTGSEVPEGESSTGASPDEGLPEPRPDPQQSGRGV